MPTAPRPLVTALLLDVWERGRPLPPAQRALLLLVATCSEEEPEVLARWPVGRRDAWLLGLRASTFGDRIDGLVACPACGERLELSLSAAALQGEVKGPFDPPAVLAVERAGYTVRFRLPSTQDLAALAVEDQAGPEHLLARCVLEARRDDEVVPADELPAPVAAAVAERMEAVDPGAARLLALACPTCGHRWEAPFDIVSYLWEEIDQRAHRALRDVHALASAYGWREADILALSSSRRQEYLNLIRA